MENLTFEEEFVNFNESLFGNAEESPEFRIPEPSPIGVREMLSAEAQRPEVRNKWRSREIRLAALQMLKTHTYSAVCKHFAISKQTLYLWKKQMIEEHTLEPRGSRGRHRVLTAAQASEVAAQLARVPTTTNEQLVAHIGANIHPATISRYTKRMGITRKKISDDEVLLIDDRVLNECREFYEKIKEIPWDRRVYMDESFVYNNEAPTIGRAPRGQRIFRARARHGKRWTIYFAIRHDGMVHRPIMRKKNADDKEFLAYVRDDFAPKLRAGDVVFWDRLGKAGRCRNPTKQHFNPECKQLIESAGATVMFLPPKGKYFNPIELAFGTLKGHIRKTYSTSIAAAEKRPRTEEELQSALNDATDSISSDIIRGYFRERADGRGFQESFPDVWNFII